MNAQQSERDNLRKHHTGVVTSNKMQKTIVVQIRRKALHPLYGKVIEKANKFKVHDEKNEAKLGDVVRIAETRPLSKDKHWRLVEIVQRASAAVREAAEARDQQRRSAKKAQS